MKRLTIIFFLIPRLLFSIELFEVKSENFTLKVENGVTIQDEILKISEDFDNKIEKDLKLKSFKPPREIVILKSLDSYNEYLTTMGIENREDYIFIHYKNQHSKVVIYQSKEISEISLKHHLVLQYVDHFTSGAPYWFTLGLATYFESSNLNRWVNTLRRSSNKEKIFTSLLKGSKENIKPYSSWILIDYLIKTENKEHNRLLWDTLSYLKYNNDDSKEKTIIDNFKKQNLDSSIFNYLESIKGYEDYMNTAVEFYQNKEYQKAVFDFKNATLLESNNFSPEYYLGLCYSGLKQYSEAYSHFSLSLDKGAPKDIVYYSIGINFFTNKEFVQAKKYLTKLEDKMYQNMAQEVLNEIEKY